MAVEPFSVSGMSFRKALKALGRRMRPDLLLGSTDSVRVKRMNYMHLHTSPVFSQLCP
jgi:hypothetical protein